jgi:hypothetical protein
MFAHREQSKWFHQFGRPSSLRMDQLDGSGLRRVPHNAQATSSLALTPIAAGSGRVTDGSVLAARELPPTRHEWAPPEAWLPNIWGHSQDWTTVRKPIAQSDVGHSEGSQSSMRRS